MALERGRIDRPRTPRIERTEVPRSGIGASRPLALGRTRSDLAFHRQVIGASVAGRDWRGSGKRRHAVGPGRFEDGQRIPVDVKVGDRVIYSKYGGTEVSVG